MKSIVRTSHSVLKDPQDINARRAMMIDGALAHDGFTSFGKSKRFIVHKAEHRLSGHYPELAHGQGIALLLVPYLTINKELFKEKLIRFGKTVFDLEGDISEEDSIHALDNWIHTLPISQTFDSLPFVIAKEDIDKALETLKLTNI